MTFQQGRSFEGQDLNGVPLAAAPDDPRTIADVDVGEPPARRSLIG